MARILFIVKFKENYDGSCGYDGTPASFGGLYYSALLVVQMLRTAGVDAFLVQVCDNNDIDREVASYRPDIVVIEALWVVPDKFCVLSRLHPGVRWIVRCHSEIPFLAYEGVAIEWINKYVRLDRVFVASNSQYGVRDFEGVVGRQYSGKVLYLPNFYPDGIQRRKLPDGVLDIGAFGAMRPLKNQLIQGLAAIEFARRRNQPMRFHINSRTEQGGDAVLSNLRAIFSFSGYPLIQHHWESRADFLDTLSQTDVGLQVSFSETFDITAADTVTLGIPLVTSKEVVWALDMSKAWPTNTASIVERLRLATGAMKESLIAANIQRLRSFCAQSRDLWMAFAS